MKARVSANANPFFYLIGRKLIQIFSKSSGLIVQILQLMLKVEVIFVLSISEKNSRPHSVEIRTEYSSSVRPLFI